MDGYPYQAGIGQYQPYFKVALRVMADTDVKNPDKQWAAPVVETWPVWEFYEVNATRPLEHALQEVL